MSNAVHASRIPGLSKLALCLLTFCGLGCGSGEEPKSQTAPVLLLGVDGVGWNVVLPLIREGRMPNFAKVMERGTYGRLETFIPTFSPVIWTTVATGKKHEKHGIHHFAKRENNELGLFDSRDRKTKAIWNIMSDNGRSVNSVGWWMTWPTEPIDGVMVAQTNTTAQLNTQFGQNIWKGGLLRGVPDQVYPAARQNEMITHLENAEQRLENLSQEIFGSFEHPLTKLGETLWENCLWAFRADATYLDISLHLAKEDQPDLTMLYFGGPDVVGHRFWRYMEPELYLDEPSPEQVANFGDVISDYYAYADRALGELLEAYGPDTNVIIVSDHGMHAVNMQRRFDPDNPPPDINSGNHQDAPMGVFIAAGPDIKKDASLPAPAAVKLSDLSRVGGVADITPTILAMFEIPIGKDMDGSPIASCIAQPDSGTKEFASIPTHDTKEFFEERLAREQAVDPGEAERIKQLRDLGYIGDE